MGFPSVAVNLCMHPTEAHPHPSPSGPVQRAGRSIDPRGSAAQADRSHPLEGEGAKQGKGAPLEGKGAGQGEVLRLRDIAFADADALLARYDLNLASIGTSAGRERGCRSVLLSEVA